MEKSEASTAPAGRLGFAGGSANFLTIVTVVAALFFAREVLMPVALAVLFSFLLAPLVNRLRKWHIPRVPSVLIVVTLAMALAAGLGDLMVIQMVDLAHRLPEYQQNIEKKIQSIVGSGRGIIGRGAKSIEQLRKEILPAQPTPQHTTDGEHEARPVPVQVQNSEFSPLAVIRSVLSSLFNLVLDALIVTILVIFMLVEREDLRERLIRMIGPSKLNATTQFFDDASQRVSRYLLMQLVVNLCYAIPIGIALYFIGIPNPLLWAMLTTLLRYIPYAGVWIAASMPFLLAMAVDPDWEKPLLVLGCYIVMEIVVANFIEPWIYGSSTGITPLGVLLAAIFWAWLWGPVGLLLSIPLTVCLASVGRYIPSFGFLRILLADEPVLSPGARFYQRMLAMNQQDARELAETFVKENSLQELYDTMIIPAMVSAGQDRQRGLLDDDKHQFILQNIRFLVDDLAPENTSSKINEPPPASGQTAALPFTICLAPEDEADEIAAVMLAQLLEQKGIAVKTVQPDTATNKLDLGEARAGLVCIPAVPPSGLLPARRMYKQLGVDFPTIKILAGVLGARDSTREFQNFFPKAVPENLVTSFKQAIERILQLCYPANSDAKAVTPASA